MHKSPICARIFHMFKEIISSDQGQFKDCIRKIQKTYWQKEWLLHIIPQLLETLKKEDKTGIHDSACLITEFTRDMYLREIDDIESTFKTCRIMKDGRTFQGHDGNTCHIKNSIYLLNWKKKIINN